MRQKVLTAFAKQLKAFGVLRERAQKYIEIRHQKIIMMRKKFLVQMCAIKFLVKARKNSANINTRRIRDIRKSIIFTTMPMERQSKSKAVKMIKRFLFVRNLYS